MPNQKPRWHYRFDNFKRAFTLLREGVETMQERPLTQLEKEGMIQRFEYTWELAWKTLKDYLEQGGIALETVTPAAVIKAAYAAKIIPNGEAWMAALDARNKMSHTYDIKVFEAIIADIAARHLTTLAFLYEKLLEEVALHDAF